MKKLINIFAENTILANFLTVMILLIGGISLFTIQKEKRPSFAFDQVTFNAQYRGASPSDVEQFVTIPIEEKVSEVSGLSSIESIALNGRTVVKAEIDSNVKDKSKVVDELFRVVDNITDLPDDVDRPKTYQMDTSKISIYRFAMFGNLEQEELQDISENLEDRLKLIGGVADVQTAGTRDMTIDIIVDPVKLEELDISVSEVMNVIKSWNKSAPAGYIQEGDKEISINIDENYSELEKVSGLVIRTINDENDIRVKDISTINYGLKNNRKLYRVNGKNALIMQIDKREHEDTLKLTKKIQREIDDFKVKYADKVSVRVFKNDAIGVQKKLDGLSQNAILGLVLVVLSLMIFLNFRMAIITAAGLPVAFLGSMATLQYLGYTLNNMTLVGIIIVLGMLVDDGIVIAENIFYHYQRGDSPLQAAKRGAAEVAGPVIGTVLTTVIAFTPLLYMDGIIGKFMAVLPVAVITCLVFSMIECFLILPNHTADFIGNSSSKLSDSINDFVVSKYKIALNGAIRYRWIVVTCVLIASLAGGLFLKKTFRMKLFPTKGITSFSIGIEGPQNTKISETLKVVKLIEKKLEKFKANYITDYRADVGSSAASSRLSTTGTNYAAFKVYLKDESDLDENPRYIVKKIRKAMSSIKKEGWNIDYIVGKSGPSRGRPVEVEISHKEFSKIERASEELLVEIKKLKGIVDLKSDNSVNYKEYSIKVDQQKATYLGIDISLLQQVIMSAYEGFSLTDVRIGNDKYEVHVKYPDHFKTSKEQLLNVKLKTKYNTYARLRDIATLRLTDGPGVIKRLNQRRTVTISGNIEGKKVTSYEINKKVIPIVSEMKKKYPNVLFKVGGEEKERQDAVFDTLKLMGLAVIGIYMVLSLILNSVFYPLLVVIVIPLSFIGALIILKLHGIVLSLPGIISLVGLAGIVVNDAIVMISFIQNKIKDTGKVFESIVMGGVRRIRPIVITTITTIFGLFPAAYELFGTDAFMQPMSLIIGWGLAVATFVTLLFIPCLLGCLYDMKLFLKKTVSS